MVQTVRAVLAQRPHALVIIDSPAFTLRVARFVHWFDRSIPIVDYVSPSVWAWRAGRARSMSALYRSRAGAAAVRARRASQARRAAVQLCRSSADRGGFEAAPERGRGAAPQRRSAGRAGHAGQPQQRGDKARRHLRRDAGAALRNASGRSRWWCRPFRISSRRSRRRPSAWPIKPRIVVEQADKQAALRVARAALAKSGTTTLELAVAGVPMVAAYKVVAARSLR